MVRKTGRRGIKKSRNRTKIRRMRREGIENGLISNSKDDREMRDRENRNRKKKRRMRGEGKENELKGNVENEI